MLNKLLEDGNILFRKGRLTDAAYRYEYALRRMPRLRPDGPNGLPAGHGAASSLPSPASEDIFGQLKTHLLLNLSRTKRKLGNFKEAETNASQVIALRPQCHEAWWARAKSRSDQDRLHEALGDLREALKLAPNNLQLHAFSIQVKTQLETQTSMISISKEVEAITKAKEGLEAAEAATEAPSATRAAAASPGTTASKVASASSNLEATSAATTATSDEICALAEDSCKV